MLVNMMNSIEKIAVIDLETTGPNISEGDKIIQIGLVIYSKGQILHEYSMLINPERDIPFHIQQLTGIKVEDVEKAPSFSSVVKLWHQRLKDCIFVAHNLDFDLSFMKEAFAKHDIDFNPVAIDSVKLAKIILPRAQGFNLTDLSRLFDIEFNGAHDALADAKVTSQILSALAYKVLKMPQAIIEEMAPFIANLRHDELMFFQQAHKFCLEEEYDLKPDSELMDFTLNKIESIQSKYINQEWQDYPSLIIEDKLQPINHKIALDLALENSKDSKTLISLPSLSDLNFMDKQLNKENIKGKYMVLKPANQFLHQEAFQYLIENYNFDSQNQQELLKITASIHWKASSAFGDYNEINQELNVQPLLEKYCSHILSNHNHSNYRKLLEKAKESHLLFTYDQYLQKLYKSDHPIGYSLMKRKLIIYNLSLFIQTARFTYQVNFHLSKLFTSLRSLISHYNFLKSENKVQPYQIKQLEDCSQLVSRFNEIIYDILDEEDYDLNLQQEIVNSYLKFSSDSFNEIKHLLREINTCLKKLLTTFSETKFDNIRHHKINIEYLHKQLTAILSQSFADKYFVVKAKRIRNKYYEMEVIIRPLVFTRGQLNWLNSFSAALLMSPGDYHYNDRFGLNSWVNLDNFQYSLMPELKSIQKKPVYLPAEYIQETKDSKRAEDFTEYLIDNMSVLKPLIIIITANQKQNELIYQKLLMKEGITSQYSISAQSISGSSNRIRRRLLEAERNIIIITERFFYKEYWSHADSSMDIYLYNLPFYSSKQTDIMAISEYLATTADTIESFETVQLPMMIQRFKYLLSYISQYYPKSDFYLLDKRIYTKYYGSKVIEALAPITDFNLMD